MKFGERYSRRKNTFSTYEPMHHLKSMRWSAYMYAQLVIGYDK